MKYFKHFLIGALIAASGVAFAATFQLFSPATGILKGNASTYVTTAATSADIRGLWSGACDLTTFLRGDGACSQVSLTTNVTGTLPVGNGGTGTTSLTGIALGNGTLPFTAYTGTSCTNQFPRSLNASGVATCSSVSLTADVTGTLPIANGGTGATSKAAAFDALSPMITLGDIIYGGASGTGTRLAGNTTTNVLFLAQLGTGSGSAAPVWSTLPNNFSGFANPSVPVGLTAVNGSATTAMRSDSAPALSQSIVPTWSGMHTFTTSPRLAFNAAAIEFYNTANTTRSGFLQIATSTASVGTEIAVPFSIFTNGTANPRITFDSDGSWDLAGTTPGTAGQVITSNGSAAAPTWNTITTTYSVGFTTGSAALSGSTANATTWTVGSCSTGTCTVTMTGVNCSTSQCFVTCSSEGAASFSITATPPRVTSNPGSFVVRTFNSSAASVNADTACTVTRS